MQKAGLRPCAPPPLRVRPSVFPQLRLQRALGNRGVETMLKARLQAKLRIAPADDPPEREADHVADQAMRPPGPEFSINRRCAACEASPASPGEAPASVHDVLRSPGRPLDAATRARFEPRFGRDFSQVRVHAGRMAERSARDLGAQAYTVGHDIVFGAGRFAPETHAGQRLIAHELAHVVQQSNGNDASVGQTEHRPGLPTLPTRLVQRKLLVRNKPKPKHIRALFDLLESPSGLTLRYESTSEEVSISASRALSPSPALTLRLEQIIDDPRVHAELRLGGAQPGVFLGKFPQTGPLIQEIDIEDLARLEAGAPGNGVAILFHEIAENYHAHAFGQDYEESHHAALEAERQVAGEIVGPGGPVARALVDKGRGVIRWVFDYEQYFLVHDRDLKANVGTSSRRSPRVNVGTFTLAGFARGADAVPRTAQPVIQAVANAMRMSPAATVRIESDGRHTQLALRRAARVQTAILDHGKGRKLHGFDLRSGFNFNLVATGRSDEGLVIVVDQPDTEVEEQRGRLVKAWLTGRSRRQAPTPGAAPPSGVSKPGARSGRR
jgi:hypothetical protein